METWMKARNLNPKKQNQILSILLKMFQVRNGLMMIFFVAFVQLELLSLEIMEKSLQEQGKTQIILENFVDREDM